MEDLGVDAAVILVCKHVGQKTGVDRIEIGPEPARRQMASDYLETLESELGIEDEDEGSSTE